MARNPNPHPKQAGVPIDMHRSFSEDTEVWRSARATAPGGVLWGSLPSDEDEYWRLVVSGNGMRILSDPYVCRVRHDIDSAARP